MISARLESVSTLHNGAKNPWLVFIESNTSGTGRLFASTAAASGYQPVILTDRPDRYPYIEADSLSYLHCDTGSLPALQESIERLKSCAPIAGVFSSSEYYVETASTLAQFYRLEGSDPESVKICRNKALQRQELQRAGLITPRFNCVVSLAEARAVLRKAELPVILKPVVGSGSVGVKLCFTREEALEHAAVLLRRNVNERGIPIPPGVLVEEYLRGDEFSIETMGGKVIGITKKHVSREPFFVETGHDFPAELGAEAENAMRETADRALKAMGLLWGPGHIELRWTAAGPAIIEINPRLAGGFIPAIVSLATGIDMIQETVNLVTGHPVNLRWKSNDYASIRFVIPVEQGIITGWSGVEEARQIEGVEDVHFYRRTGDRFLIQNDFRDRIGHVIARAGSRRAAIEAVELGLSKIRVEMASL
jgi:S-sulfo-L-cysteine synthase (3-phospho-L-serine-dependent)